MVSVVIPYIVENEQQADIVHRCFGLANQFALSDTEVIGIDNGSTYSGDNHPYLRWAIHYNKENTGVLATFKQGYELATGNIICFIHSDVLLHEPGWDKRISDTFEADPQLGLAGLFGATGIGTDGGREFSMSNMLGKEWGKCTCHSQAALHHGALETGVKPAAVFDGVGLFFRRETLRQLVETTDMFDDWRAPHHFYDRIMSCKVAALGWHMAVIGIGFDHWSGATANASEVYNKTASEWLGKHLGKGFWRTPDSAIYQIAEQQFFKEFRHRLPLRVGGDYSYRWQQ